MQVKPVKKSELKCGRFYLGYYKTGEKLSVLIMNYAGIFTQVIDIRHLTFNEEFGLSDIYVFSQKELLQNFEPIGPWRWFLLSSEEAFRHIIFEKVIENI
jgi:hypothetical protein